MVYTIRGSIYEIGETQQITEKFKKRELILFVENKDKPEYSDYVKLEAIQDKCDELDSIPKGRDVECSFFITGRKYEKNGQVMFFTTLRLKDVSLLEGQKNEPTPNKEASAIPQVDNSIMNEEDDLPF